MKSLEALFHPFAAAWGPVMWRACWQGGLALLLVWGVIAAFPQLPGRVRCWFWRVAFLKLLLVLCLPASIDLPWLPRTPAYEPVAGTTASQPMHGTSTEEPLVAPEPARPPLATLPERPAVPVTPSRSSTVAISSANQGSAPATGLGATNKTSWLAWGWFCGVAMAGLQLIRLWRRLRNARLNSAVCLQPGLNQQLATLGACMQLRRLPELRLTHQDLRPALVGFFRPVILLPQTLLERCTPQEVRLILAHELAHCQRRDLWWNWLPLLAHVCFFFHPLVWLACRKLRLAQEMAADERVIATQPTTTSAYAQALLRVCELIAGPASVPSGPLVAGVVESTKILKQRLIAMKHYHLFSRRQLAMLTAVTAGIAAATLLPWRLVAQAPDTASTTPPRASTAQPTSAGGTEDAINVKPVEGAERVNFPAQEGTPPNLWTKLYPLKAIAPAELADLLAPIVAPPGFLMADANTRSLRVTAPKEMLAGIDRLIARLNAQPSETRIVRVFHLRQADPAALAEILAPLLHDAGVVTSDPRTHALVITAPQDVFAGVERLLEKLDSAPVLATQTRMYKLKFAEAAQVANAIRPALSRTNQLALDARSNAIIIAASTEEIRVVDQLIKELDVAVESPLQVRVFALKYLDPDQATTVIRTAFGAETKVAPDSRSHSLVVSASADTLSTIQSLLQTLDVPGQEPATTTQKANR